jgi:hypothetical protein
MEGPLTVIPVQSPDAFRLGYPLHDEDVIVERARTTKAPARVPADFASAFQKNRKARAAFDAFSPSHKRKYVEPLPPGPSASARLSSTGELRHDSPEPWRRRHPQRVPMMMLALG